MERVDAVIEAAKEADIPIRIGVNLLAPSYKNLHYKTRYDP